MRKNSKLVDLMFLQAQKLFPALRLPLAWDKLKNSNMAEWSNNFVDGFGEFHMIKLNFKLHKNKKDLYDSICHELIHAWQYENKIETNHGLEFCEWVIMLAKNGINASSSDCHAKTLKKAYKRLNKKGVL
jgi:hypothetical protein